MSQPASSHKSVLLSRDALRIEFQIAAMGDYIVLDIQARNFATDGHQHTHYALADLSMRDARRLRDLLNQAIAASQDAPDPRQTSLWSNDSVRAVADELRRGRLA